jgi:DNA-binding NarL/FixJ family response regulator
MTRLVLVDDQVLFVESLKSVLGSRAKEIDVVGVAHCGEEALKIVERERPDVVLMDVRMPGMDGVEATRRIKERWPETHIIMLTTYDEDAYVQQALLNGALGYLLKDLPPDDLIESIRALRQGTVLMSTAIADRLVRKAYIAETEPRPAAPSPEWLKFLTGRELAILKLIVEGLENKQIADQLHLAEQTVKNSVSLIYSKMNVSSRIQAVRLVGEYGDDILKT